MKTIITVFPSLEKNIEKLEKISDKLVKALENLEAGKITLNQSKTIAQLANHAIRAITTQILLEQQVIEPQNQKVKQLGISFTEVKDKKKKK